MNGIITLPLVPLRERDDERSELYSQLLFGERIEILEIKENWFYVRNLADNYKGWVDQKMIQILTLDENERFAKATLNYVQLPLLLCDKTTSNERIFLPGGSIIYAPKEGKFAIGEETYALNASELNPSLEITGEHVLYLAIQYMNAPYLWGGKSILGIDCSGLVQVVFAMCGIHLLRDASEQVDSGKVINFLSETKAGDLAFFENSEGRIIHVGLLLNSHQIIHASGWVKVESIDLHGIISTKTGEYTHKLRVIKRIL